MNQVARIGREKWKLLFGEERDDLKENKLKKIARESKNDAEYDLN